MLTFDAEKHEYRFEGRRVPNVTSIIKHLSDYSQVPPEKLEQARQEGQAVHLMVELDCKGTLNPDDPESLPEWLRPYFAAWRTFLDHAGFEIWRSEYRLHHKGMDYAGTLDLAGELHKTKKKGPALIDIKRSFMGGPAIGVQLAAYRQAWNAEATRGERINNRFALRLKPGAEIPYHLIEFNDPLDEAMFNACLVEWKWREKHGRT